MYNANQLKDVCTEFIANNLGTLMEARFEYHNILLRALTIVKEHARLIPCLMTHLNTAEVWHAILSIFSDLASA